MCPTFIATGEEIMTTRGPGQRDPRGVWKMRGLHEGDPLRSRGAGSGAEQLSVLQGLHDRVPVQREPGAAQGGAAARAHQRDGLSLRERLFSSVDLLGSIGCRCRGWPTRLLDSLFVRSISGSKTLGIAWQRPLPHYARQRFDHWFARGGPQPPPRHAGGWCSGTTPSCAITSRTSAWRR